MTVPASELSPFKTTISSVFSAVLASPLANMASIRSCSSVMRTCCEPKPRSSCRACFSSSTRSETSSAFSTNTLQRERSAALTSNDGFSVVAPIKIILPFSTYGKKASCWALLKRCISSTNTIVFLPYRRASSASFITALISRIPLVTALKLIKCACVCLAMILASVVFPTPGGPQKIMEETISFSIRLYSIFPFPSRCFCPT